MGCDGVLVGFEDLVRTVVIGRVRTFQDVGRGREKRSRVLDGRFCP